jgi:signal transduction histidine kinase
MLSRAARKAHGGVSGELLGELAAVKEVVEQTLQKVRDWSQMFRPAVLDDFGLEQTLEWYGTQFARQTGIKVHFDGKLRSEVYPPEDSIHVYRIVQEALNNVARHARVQEAWAASVSRTQR